MASPAAASGGPTPDARVVRTRNDVLRTTLQVLVEEGRDAVNHRHIAQVAGYSRATLYAHWPSRADLFRDAFARLVEVPHHTRTGDLRADLIAELTMFRTAMQHHGLHRTLAVLGDLAATDDDIAAVRDGLVVHGERIVRELLHGVLRGEDLEAAALMLSGAILYSALLHGRLPSDRVIAATVDLTLRGSGYPPSRA